MTQVSGGNGERVTIIRPSFMKITQGTDTKPDGCRAALFNHILYWISQKARGISVDNIRSGNVYYYAKTEELTDQMSHAWEVCKVRKEVNVLLKMGLLGRITNPLYGVDRTKHFIFGAEQCRRFLEICQEQSICLHQLGLPSDMMHLIYSSNAYMNKEHCCCGQMIHLSEQMIDVSGQMIDVSEANDISIGAITKNSTKVTPKDTNKEQKESSATTVATPSLVLLETSKPLEVTVMSNGNGTGPHKDISPTPPSLVLIADDSAKDNPPKKGKGRASKKPALPPSVEEDEEALARRRGIYQRIIARRGYELEGEEKVTERKYVKLLSEKFTDAQIEAIHKYLFERDWKWSKMDNKFKIGPYIIWKEANNVAQILKAEKMKMNGSSSSSSDDPAPGNAIATMTREEFAGEFYPMKSVDRQTNRLAKQEQASSTVSPFLQSSKERSIQHAAAW